jgi:hypothetical protein
MYRSGRGRVDAKCEALRSGTPRIRRIGSSALGLRCTGRQLIHCRILKIISASARRPGAAGRLLAARESLSSQSGKKTPHSRRPLWGQWD